ncbi:MAG: BMP family ABC transporter substrate-binding protein [Hydrogenibacillus schlegelii]|nr:BMP family ABC transporter substrate-binding protein [Hydrogenibacillus schlegelii]
MSSIRIRRTLGALGLAAALALAGCGTSGGGAGKAPGAETPGGPAKEKPFRVGMVTDTGGVNDNSFNQSAWEGLSRLKNDTGAEVRYLESKDEADYIPNLNQFVQSGFDLTWGIGYMMADPVKTVAQEHPEAHLALIDGEVDGVPNVASVRFNEQEGAFLVGVVAGKMTQTNKVGFVGGMELPVIKRFEVGFKAGVKAANPNAEVLITYTGAFNKPDEGKAAAASLYDKGADIVFHAAGQTGDGVFSEAKERRKRGEAVWVIGVDRDQRDLGPEVTLTSMLKRVDVAVYTVSKQAMEGTFTPGVTVLGLKEDGVGLPADNPHLPPEVLGDVEAFKAKILNGEIAVPKE